MQKKLMQAKIWVLGNETLTLAESNTDERLTEGCL